VFAGLPNGGLIAGVAYVFLSGLQVLNRRVATAAPIDEERPRS
jgi:hypothetical protein